MELPALEDDQLLVAVHECAHAVIAHCIGATVTEIAIQGERYQDDSIGWTGNVKLEEKKLSRDLLVQIALAGPIAEVRIRAMQHCGLMQGLTAEPPVQSALDEIGSLDSIVNALKAVGQDANADPKAMYADVRLVVRERVENARICLGNCYGDAREALKAADGDREVLASAARLVLRQLNYDGVWFSVVQFAFSLIALPTNSSLRKVLVNDETIPWLEKAKASLADSVASGS